MLTVNKMYTEHIAKKVGLEPFLINHIEDVSRDRDLLKSFLEDMNSNYDSLNRVFITGGAEVHLSHRLNLNYAGSRLEEAVIEISNAGGFNIYEPGKKGIYTRICPHADEDSNNDVIEVEDKETFASSDMIVTFNRRADNIYAEIKVKPLGRIYAVHSVDNNSAILLRDSHFWQSLAQEIGLNIQAIGPKYTGKRPVTPWYEAVDQESGATITMGRRYRVDEISIDFKEPVPIGPISDLFGQINTTIDINGKPPKCTNEDNQSDEGEVNKVHSFMIHAWTPEETKKYTSQLLDIARGKIN